MSFFKKTLLCSLLNAALIVPAIANTNSPTLNEQDRAMLERSRAIMKKSIEMETPDWLRMYDPDAAVQKTESGIQKWIPTANNIANTSEDYVKGAIKKAYGVTDGSQIKTIDNTLREDSPLFHGEELYYFISFSQPESEIKEILQAASDADARVILKGMKQGHRMVNETAQYAYQLGKHISPLPKVAIDPRLLQVFDINAAPSMVYRKGNKFVKVNGVASLNWFISKSRESKGITDLGSVSSTYEIEERDVIEEIQSRAAAVDWDEKRRKAMSRYINKLPDFHIPTAIKDSIYKLDPRVKFNKDVTAKDGSLLAVKGQIVNPVDHFPGQSMTIFIFDGQSEAQKALVKERMKSAKGQIGLVTSRVDKEKGFDYLGELNKEYGQQVYVLQKRIIERFKLRHIPAEVYLGNGQIVVREHGLKSQDEARIKQREAEFINTSNSPEQQALNNKG